MKVTRSDRGIDGWVCLVLTGNGLRVDCQLFHDFIGIVVKHLLYPSLEQTKILHYRYYKIQFFYIFYDILLMVDVKGILSVFLLSKFFLVYFQCSINSVIEESFNSVF